MRISLHNADKPLSPDSDTILVMGDGNSLMPDLKRFLSWGLPHDVGALGRGIKEYPGQVHHWFNADGDSAIQWAENLPNGDGTIRHTFGDVRGFDVDWDIDQPDYHHSTITGDAERFHGSSALFATLACLEMGYRRIVLAGCPLDSEGHYYFANKTKETLGPIWLGYDFMAWLDFSKNGSSDKVRSMSGYTKIILGDATRAWIEDAL